MCVVCVSQFACEAQTQIYPILLTIKQYGHESGAKGFELGCIQVRGVVHQRRPSQVEERIPPAGNDVSVLVVEFQEARFQASAPSRMNDCVASRQLKLGRDDSTSCRLLPAAF